MSTRRGLVSVRPDLVGGCAQAMLVMDSQVQVRQWFDIPPRKDTMSVRMGVFRRGPSADQSN